jgi:hypothetical protein
MLGESFLTQPVFTVNISDHHNAPPALRIFRTGCQGFFLSARHTLFPLGFQTSAFVFLVTNL